MEEWAEMRNGQSTISGKKKNLKILLGKKEPKRKKEKEMPAYPSCSHVSPSPNDLDYVEHLVFANANYIIQFVFLI